MSADTLQAQIDQLKPGETITLNPPRNEFKGPLIIRAPAIIEGQGGTIWAREGPVLRIQSANVLLRDLNLEITSREPGLTGLSACALVVEPSLSVGLENVAVRGEVRGVAHEEGSWRCPRTLSLGTIKAGMPHEFKVLLMVPVPCIVESEIDGLQIQPRQLRGEPVSVLLRLDPMPTGTRLRGQVKIKTASLTRRLTITGNVSDGAAVIGNGQILWQPDDLPLSLTSPTVEAADLPLEISRAPKTTLMGVPNLSLDLEPDYSPQLEGVPPLPPLPDMGSTLVVSQLEPGQYQTIREALQRARTGARILVRPGLYRESLTLDKKVEIIGDGPAADIVVESPDSHCLHMQADLAKVRGLTLRGVAGRTSHERYTVLIPEGQLILEDCWITSDSLACVAIHGSGTAPILRRCQIHGSKSAGVLVYDRGEGTLEDCDIYDNDSAGIESKQRGNPVLRQCRIHGNREGLFVHEDGKATLEDCDIHDNALAGVEIKQGGNPVLLRCKIHNGRYPGLRVQENGQGRLEDCDIYDNALAGVEIKQGGNPVLLRCKIRESKQAGLLCAGNSLGTLEECDIFGNGLAGVEIRQGSNPTLKRCTIHESSSVGVLIRDKGKGTLEDCDIFETGLNAVELRQGAAPVLRRCKIHASKQAGLVVTGKSTGSLENCAIFGNKSSGVLITAESHPTLKSCQIHDNTLAGVVIGEEGKGLLEKCEITANGLAGLVILKAASPSAHSCKITGNGDVAIWAHKHAGGTVQECDLTNNEGGSLDLAADVQVKLVKNKVDSA